MTAAECLVEERSEAVGVLCQKAWSSPARASYMSTCQPILANDMAARQPTGPAPATMALRGEVELMSVLKKENAVRCGACRGENFAE